MYTKYLSCSQKKACSGNTTKKGGGGGGTIVFHDSIPHILIL